MRYPKCMVYERKPLVEKKTNCSKDEYITAQTSTIDLSVYLSIYLSIDPSIDLSTYLLRISVCLSVCMVNWYRFIYELSGISYADLYVCLHTHVHLYTYAYMYICVSASENRCLCFLFYEFTPGHYAGCAIPVATLRRPVRQKKEVDRPAPLSRCQDSGLGL